MAGPWLVLLLGMIPIISCTKFQESRLDLYIDDSGTVTASDGSIVASPIDRFVGTEYRTIGGYLADPDADFLRESVRMYLHIKPRVTVLTLFRFAQAVREYLPESEIQFNLVFLENGIEAIVPLDVTASFEGLRFTLFFTKRYGRVLIGALLMPAVPIIDPEQGGEAWPNVMWGEGEITNYISIAPAMPCSIVFEQDMWLDSVQGIILALHARGNTLTLLPPR